ncbi:MAG TPA: hypothetical protein VM012_09770 [Flavitalea sp.]|nr:hypothetical protein [Flavitalea sp.]
MKNKNRSFAIASLRSGTLRMTGVEVGASLMHAQDERGGSRCFAHARSG